MSLLEGDPLGNTPNLEVVVASGDRLDVRQFAVHERISSLFGVEIVALSKNHDIDFEAVLGRPARFAIHSMPRERFWSGICSRMQQIGCEEDGGSTYRITIVPTLWLLTQRRNHRMFQQSSELDIARKILEEWGIEVEPRLSGSYKKRKYRVQYAESDFAFMARMLEDAGISFFFEQGKKETRLILSDAPQRSETRAPAVSYKDDTSMVTGEYVTRLESTQQVRPGRYTMRDHDYRRPAGYKLVASAEDALGDVEKKLERYHYSPGAFLFGTDAGESTPSADDRGKARTDEKEGALLAQKRLEAKRADGKIFSFLTSAMDLAPGVVMQLRGHPRSKLNKERLLVIAVTHSGTPYGEITHHCEARSAEQAYRPPSVTPRPKVNGVESATVVGPAGEEIHTDEFGRVRVHFHWDRESGMDEKSSCWIHVSQPWGGAGYGATNLPRIGQEVLVDFLGGDPDRPVIVGRVYTNLQKTPYKLPESKTQSGWKSNSTGGGGGYNEMMFEDAAGKELLRMQAEKDLKKLVKNDESVTIGHNLTKVVGNNEREVTGNNRTVSVGVNRSTQIGQIDSTVVGDTHVVQISPPGEGPSGSNASVTMKDKKIVVDTGGGAKIVLEGSSIRFTAKDISFVAWNSFNVLSCNQASIGGMMGLTLSSAAGDVIIRGGPMVKINES